MRQAQQLPEHEHHQYAGERGSIAVRQVLGLAWVDAAQVAAYEAFNAVADGAGFADTGGKATRIAQSTEAPAPRPTA